LPLFSALAIFTPPLFSLFSPGFAASSSRFRPSVFFPLFSFSFSRFHHRFATLAAARLVSMPPFLRCRRLIFHADAVFHAFFFHFATISDIFAAVFFHEAISFSLSFRRFIFFDRLPPSPFSLISDFRLFIFSLVDATLLLIDAIIISIHITDISLLMIADFHC
jgi:hypothetical protein